MCQRCNDGYDPEDEDYGEDETIEEQWEAFYDHLEYFDYELAGMADANITDISDYDASMEFLESVRDAFVASLKDSLDSDGIHDVQRRFQARGQYAENAVNALTSDTYEVMLAGVQLGVYQNIPETGATSVSLEVSFRDALYMLGIQLQEKMMDQAIQYQLAGHDVDGIDN